jgi:hypothetical protein
MPAPSGGTECGAEDESNPGTNPNANTPASKNRVDQCADCSAKYKSDTRIHWITFLLKMWRTTIRGDKSIIGKNIGHRVENRGIAASLSADDLRPRSSFRLAERGVTLQRR